MENNFNKFRRSAFGGFNREDVISYIEKMKNEFFDYKKEVELTIDQLNSKIRELEDAFESVCAPDVNDSTVETTEEPDNVNPVSDINEATRKLRNVADELCKSISDFMLRVGENNAVAEAEAPSQEDEPVEDIPEEVCTEVEYSRVDSILRSVDSFSCTASVEESKTEKKTESETDKKNILDILGKASFLK